MIAWLVILTIGLPWLGALSVLWTRDSRPRTHNLIAVVAGSLASLAALCLLPFATQTAVIRVVLGGVFGELTFTPDGLGVMLAVIATFIGTLTIIFSADYMQGEAQQRRYYALVLFFIGSMCGLVLTNSLLLLFFFWELVAFCSYALISFHNDDPKAVMGGMKALVITQIGGVGLLIGALVAAANLGSTQIDYLLAHAAELPATSLSLIAFGFLIGAAAKSAQMPFHTWLPSAMEAPTPISALIHAATMVNAGVYLLARFYPAFANVPGWTGTIIAVGLISALLAGCMALVANDLKRILAYSTISQLGYMVYAVGIGAIFASQFHLLSHAVFKALLFLGAGAVIHAVETRDIREMGGLGRRMPFVRNVFLLGAAALVGVPIFNGFWSKELILEASFADQAWWLTAGLLVGVGLTALYTVRMVWLVFYGSPRAALHAHDAPKAMQVSLFVLAFGTLTTWALAGGYDQLLRTTLPFHNLSELSLGELVQEVVTAPITLVALISIAAGGLLWWMWLRGWLKWLARLLDAPAVAARQDFGFEWLNRQIMRLTQQIATALRTTQTGQLNWNVAGIVLGLVIVLATLLLRGGGTP
ncbi:MAG: NADH-quinone oxidoreductase subunit L [Anaerolineae bacterium]|nr:NADH-quinone oxidoreductase subunit L [Anaerolineae bacterium]